MKRFQSFLCISLRNLFQKSCWILTGQCFQTVRSFQTQPWISYSNFPSALVWSLSTNFWLSSVSLCIVDPRTINWQATWDLDPKITSFFSSRLESITLISYVRWLSWSCFIVDSYKELWVLFQYYCLIIGLFGTCESLTMIVSHNIFSVFVHLPVFCFFLPLHLSCHCSITVPFLPSIVFPDMLFFYKYLFPCTYSYSFY